MNRDIFVDDTEAQKFLESIRWRDGVECPHCNSVHQSIFLEPRSGEERRTRTGNKTYRRVWMCRVCKKEFSVTVGTIFHSSKLPLSKWLLAIRELGATKSGVSALELQRKLGIGSYRTAWFLVNRIRDAISEMEI